ncbi:PH domain-containing protein [Falsibacillus albus]|uniref:PH domain-containing protein n=1 Tax=Falsibacillus albus TaxID=2478915 RepID=A0A3L7JZ77_9BACI|nr:PH domain-containing protein [Falsibacillus albus]RLQ96188.1 PH domain-containing protein [Falsibacillus albus]
MGFLDSLLGNASEVDLEKVEKEMERILIENERIEQAYKVIRDLMVFTNKRLLLIDKQGVTGKKVDYHSVPYKSITHFSVETAGTFDLDSELKIWISSTALPISKQFRKDESVFDIQQALAKYVIS